MQKRTLHRLTAVITAAALALIAASCSSNNSDLRKRIRYTGRIPDNALPGTAFVKVWESSFTFNAAFTGRPVTGAEGLFQDIEPEFYISSAPVTATQFRSLLGKVPSPGISHEDAEKFLDALWKKTGIPFVLPTEAMYEAALHQGAISPRKGEKTYVSDHWNGAPLPERLAVQWKHSSGSGPVVLRSPYEREPVETFQRAGGRSFYVAVRTEKRVSETLLRRMNPSLKEEREPYREGDETFTVKGVAFKMKAVPGGRALLGATEEQERYAEEDEKPVRDTTIVPFKLSETEVTAGLWQAVMGYLPAGNDSHHPDHPVVGVSWYDAQEFITALNDITARTFRLPDEWEWEYAARGGTKGKGHIFSGSSRSAEVAVCAALGKDGSGDIHPGPTPVATLRPNELGLYDMSGNAWEWVRGLHPSGEAVLRGGSRMSLSAACRVSNRQAAHPGLTKDTFGFRIAL